MNSLLYLIYEQVGREVCHGGCGRRIITNRSGLKAILLQTINFTKLARYYKLIKFVASKSLGSLDEPVWDFVLIILFSACKPISPARFFPPFRQIFFN